MSEKYADNGGYKPLLLPLTGEDLLPGRQYALTPLARLILREVYGLSGVPTIVECIFADRKATRMTVIHEDLNGSNRVEKTSILDEQKCLFSAYLGNKKNIKFSLDLKKMDELAPFYDKSHKLPDLEEDWFKHAKETPMSQKFRGQSLRWWSRDESQKGTAARLSAGRTAEKLDLSILDI